MKWNKFRLKTTTEAEDIVSSMLMDLGVQGIEIEDKIPMTQAEKEQMFVDILPETGINDGIAYISFYLLFFRLCHRNLILNLDSLYTKVHQHTTDNVFCLGCCL